MRPTQRLRAAAGVSAVLLAAAVGLGLLPAAQAASVTITLSFQAPSPSNAAAATSDTIVFSNNDQVAHAVTSKTGAWSFSKSVAAGASYSVKLPTTAGTFTYSDTHNVPIFGATVDSGTVTSTAPASPRPTATPKPGSSATPKPTTNPSVTPRATASAQPTASASPPAGAPTPGSGTALAPGLGTGILTTGTPSPGAPQPNIAPALPSTTAAPAVGATAAPPVRYADRPLTQDNTHRYGLPALLAVLAVTGVASLLVRYLLAHRDPQAPQD